ncbi:hypothetical protein BDY19DRAFT_902104 [Irpex rosettiformis]|uniref:Uncharacterized protein n=1 Tax=Irpex rosettiformis TaxID=378272 RepID=A0ACB8UL69_9APHY|nr:hypothetical protein BDY19DRAFT_902104 [Irpex rosettiformis]
MIILENNNNNNNNNNSETAELEMNDRRALFRRRPLFLPNIDNRCSQDVSPDGHDHARDVGLEDDLNSACFPMHAAPAHAPLSWATRWPQFPKRQHETTSISVIVASNSYHQGSLSPKQSTLVSFRQAQSGKEQLREETKLIFALPWWRNIEVGNGLIDSRFELSRLSGSNKAYLPIAFRRTKVTIHCCFSPAFKDTSENARSIAMTLNARCQQLYPAALIRTGTSALTPLCTLKRTAILFCYSSGRTVNAIGCGTA